MRKVTSLILAFGILATAVTVTVAQVGFESSDHSPFGETSTPKRSAMTFFSRGKKKETENKITTSPKSSQVKNYHQELFGTPAPQQTYKRSSARTSQKRKSVLGVRHASAKLGKASTKRTFESELTAPKSPVEKDNKLVRAEYLRKPATSQNPVIQQTASTSEGGLRNPFDPVGAGSEAPVTPKPRGTITRPPIKDGGNVHRNPVTPVPPTRNSIRRTGVEEEFNPFGLPPVKTSKPQPKLERQLELPPMESKKTALPIDLDAFSAENIKLETVQISVGWEKKSAINVGQECQLDLIVKNESEVVARNLAVDAYFPTTVRLTKAVPMPREERDHISWAIESLKPGEAKRIKITLIPVKSGDLAVKAFVRLTGTSARSFAVNEPKLNLNIAGSKRVMLGESAAHTIVVSNPGTGVTSNVQVQAVLSKGLQHSKGSRVSLNIGSLNPGESRKIHLALTAVDGGLQQIDVITRSGLSLTRSTSSKVMVVAPSLALNVTGPKLRYVGRNALYKVVVTNSGKVATNNVRVMHKVPEGFQFIQADKSGKYNRQSRLVDWFIGQLAAGESTTLNIKLKATELGTFPHYVSVISEEGAKAESQVQTKVDGTASLVLEIVDLDDPVEVGSETAYEVRVKNDGSKAATKVQITCELPKDVQLIGAKGPTQAFPKNNQVIFKELSSLAPGKTALFRIHVKGKVEGNRRFRVRLNSSSIGEPLLFEEITKFYGE